MHARRGQFILSFLAILVGAALIYIGQVQKPVWTAGGGIFMAIGVGSLLLTLGWVLPGWPGKALRHPIFNLIAVAAVVIMIVLTAYYAFFY
jgi:hypothetical protein